MQNSDATPDLATHTVPATIPTTGQHAVQPVNIAVAISRGGLMHLSPVEAAHFIAASLEDALDLLAMTRAYLPEDDKAAHPRIGTAAVARTRIQEALDAFKKLQDLPPIHARN